MNAPTKDEQTMAGICYIGLIACLIPPVLLFVTKKDESEYIKFHSLQAIGFAVIAVVINFVGMVLGFIPFIGWLISLVLGFVVFVWWLMISIQAFQGKNVDIPVVGAFIRQKLMV